MRRGMIFVFVMMTLSATGCARHYGDDANATADKLGEPVDDPKRNAFENIKDPPITAETHFAAGQLAESQHNPTNAAKQYELALKLDPKHHQSLYSLAMLYTQTKQYPKAIEGWQRYVKLTNNSADAYSNLGFCYELAGESGHAEEAYHQGIAVDSRSQACRVNYGLMLARSGKVNDAVNQLQVVLTPAQVHYNIASVYEQQGKREQAKAEYKKAIELDPNFLDAQTRLDALVLKSAGAAQ